MISFSHCLVGILQWFTYTGQNTIRMEESQGLSKWVVQFWNASLLIDKCETTIAMCRLLDANWMIQSEQWCHTQSIWFKITGPLFIYVILDWVKFEWTDIANYQSCYQLQVLIILIWRHHFVCIFFSSTSINGRETPRDSGTSRMFVWLYGGNFIP